MTYIIKLLDRNDIDDVSNTRGVFFNDLYTCIHYAFDVLECPFLIYNLNECKVVFRSSFFRC